MGRTIKFTKKQQEQFDSWITNNYDWAKTHLIDDVTRMDVEDGIETERQAIAGNLVSLMLAKLDFQLKVFGAKAF